MKIKILFINVLLLFFSSISFAQNMSWEELLKRTQRPLIEPIRDEATGLYGYQNTKTGKIIVPCKYQFALTFSEGLGAVNVGGKVRYDAEYAEDYVCTGGLWGYVDSTGVVVIKPQFTAADQFSEGFATVEKNKLKALIDKTGKVLCPFIYEYLFPASEGLCVAAKGKPLRFGFINTEGKEVIDFDYEEANSFLKGRAQVVRYGARFYINKEGKRVN